MRVRFRPSILIALAWAGAAAADDRAERRANCEPLMTVIDAVCEAETFYVCPDGSRFSETLSTDGSGSIEVTDAEMNPIYFQDLSTGEGVRRILSTTTWFSLSDLLRTGRSQGAYTGEIVMATPFPRAAALTLSAELTGEEHTLDGVTFRIGRATVGIGLGLGGMMAVSEGPILVDPERGLLIVESATMTFNGTSAPVGADAAAVILPGQPGFQPDAAPRSCGPSLSSLPQGAVHG